MKHLNMINLALIMLLFVQYHPTANANEDIGKRKIKSNNEANSSVRQLSQDSTEVKPTPVIIHSDTLAVAEISKYPVITIEQILKGNISGSYIQEPSGEPGTALQSAYIRGIKKPLFSSQNIKQNAPLIILNGVQLITETDIIYNIQNDESLPIGSATNIMSLFDMDNIESIAVLKDAGQIAKYGPRAVNGVVYIKTKLAKGGGKNISVNAYTGLAAPNNVTTINAEFERNHRQPFYDKYANQSQIASYPSYLSDSSNVNYYGPSNWVDEYYKLNPIYSVNGGITGGTARSSFRVFANHLKSAGAADATKFQRSYGNFNVNMLPTTWLSVDGNIQIGRITRDRNKSLVDRFTETKYMPELSTPLAPNKDLYGLYLNMYDKLSFDDNLNTSVLGSLGLNMHLLKGLDFNTRISMDYNENRRDLFWPSGLMEGNNYTSNYFGYNERLIFDNTLSYLKEFHHSKLLFEGGFALQSDRQKYNYLQAYRGTNDHIKVNKVDGDKNKASYLASIGFIPYLYSDKAVHKLVNTYFKTTYQLDNFEISGLVRRDGSSWQQLSERWFTSYVFDAEYDVNGVLNVDAIEFLKLRSSYGKIGNLPNNDTESAGPQYSSSLGWDNNSQLFSYNGISTISRPYSSGWVGYDVPWSYSEMFNIGFDFLLTNNLGLKADYYNNRTKNGLLPIPTIAESGYKFTYESGMAVQNYGVDINLNYSLPETSSGFSWNTSLNIGYNNNSLLALPGGLESIIVGKNKLQVGDRIDRYWLLENRGVFLTDLDVPVSPTDYKVLTYNGVDMKGGDPRWIDQDGNFDINNDDRVLLGNILPKWSGGFYNHFKYKNFDLGAFLYFNIGREILNQQAAKYYDFANVSESRNLYGVRDITYWEKNFDESNYAFYNPWSSVTPYQTEQDMFMEDGSFLKLKNLSIGYDFKDIIRKGSFNKAYLYLSGTNLLTITKYSGRDPELVNFFGYDTGNGIRYPKMFTLGLKLDF